jgi:phosphoribosylformylglycinamidine synthase
MVGAKITCLEDIKCSANWMWAAKLPGEGPKIYQAAQALKDILIELGMAIDGGKDSLSMAAKTIDPQGKMQMVKAPGELVIAGYAPMEDVTCRVTAELYTEDEIGYIDLSNGRKRLGGSALAQVYGQLGNECPDVEDIGLLKRTFQAIQELIEKKIICSVHDVSDGGLITALLEMAFAGNVGFEVNVNSRFNSIEFFFSEEPGLVIGFNGTKREELKEVLSFYQVPFQLLGLVNAEPQIEIRYNDLVVLNTPMERWRRVWESTSAKIDSFQANPDCVVQETGVVPLLDNRPNYRLTFEPKESITIKPSQASLQPKVAILRTQGSNGDREMAAAFLTAGFEPWDVTITDLLQGKISLDQFRGVAFVGGFSFGDVLDAGKGWAGVIRFNPKVKEEFDRFYHRLDTFSLGVCNGCQLMALLGWVPYPDLADSDQPRFIRNLSERFESRFAWVKIESSPSMMLAGMVDSVLGIWVAHGEGRLYLPQETMLKKILDDQLAPLRFVDHRAEPTIWYPFNPNGSPLGITALCSKDGRHLAMMPHPERTFQLRQWPWLPKEFRDLEASPWLKLFQNAYDWCQDN